LRKNIAKKPLAVKTKIQIVYDNRLHKAGLKTGWGFSALIETNPASTVLFDTGDNGDSLLHNMQQLGIDPKIIGTIVISHAHFDHAGGLSTILAFNKHASVYIPASVEANIPNRKVIRVGPPLQIADNVYSTGELNRIEQSLVLKTGKGIVVVTGCSHPGVGTILDAASSHGSIYGIIGGFHGFSDFGRLDALSLICPCHCTQYKAELEEKFPDKIMACGAGLQLEL
jgi:7,8-dihydropterin-6-yl-methyl-4-(beta-D-ribofuranosyl)aminobenzene 5'-phosphate synthase